VTTQRPVPLVLRWAFAWGRWAAKHPLIATAVYILELLVAPALWWLVFGFGWIAALVFLAVEVVGFFVALPLWANRQRRRKGLPPLPPLWSRAFTGDR
jgi:hypothetical protein